LSGCDNEARESCRRSSRLESKLRFRRALGNVSRIEVAFDFPEADA
jgi:hypothetical protein